MRYAKSMYRGGIIVDASVCDYESSRHLGIVCPFCSQAVFLRSGTFYERNGRQIVVSPAFAHYHNDDPLSEDCELRSLRKDGQEYLQQLEIESRNQRLDLYNKRLWDVFREDLNVISLKEIVKTFGSRWIEQTSRASRQDLARTPDFYVEEARQVWADQLLNLSAFDTKLPKTVGASAWTDAEKIADFKRLNDFDRQLHQVVFEEIIQFLAARTAGYAYEKIFTVGLWEWCATYWVATTQKKASAEAIKAYADQVKRFHLSYFNKVIIIMIVRVNWVKLFYSLGGDDAE